MILDSKFWKDKSVLLTGHTGFKGAWMALLLNALGAKVTGIALAPENDPNLFTLLEPWSKIDSYFFDISDRNSWTMIIQQAKPEIVIHLAAQALVRKSYHSPVETFATNVMGTLHLLDTLRTICSCKIALIVTSDKVYQQQQNHAFSEQDRLGGEDPYSASKACIEIAVAAWRASFCSTQNNTPIIATARAGNIIGGGDFSEERLIPDAVRAYQEQKKLELRYPNAIRPWQYVLDVVSAYLVYIQKLSQDSRLPLALNFGPSENEVLTVSEMLDLFQAQLGKGLGWSSSTVANFPERENLLLDSHSAYHFLNWKNKLTLRPAVEATARWYRAYIDKKNMKDFTNKQLQEYLQLLSLPL